MHEKFLALLMEIEKRGIYVQIIFGWDRLSLFGHFNETDIYDSNDDHQNCSYSLDLDFSIFDFGAWLGSLILLFVRSFQNNKNLSG